MKIRVALGGGRSENLTLTEPITIERGTEYNAIRTSMGVRFYFTQDGMYSSWTVDVGKFDNEEERKAFFKEFTDVFESQREIFEPGGESNE